MKIVVVSGGFDPLHSGHIEYFNAASDLGNKLIVALNSDNWLNKKKGKFFMPFDERKSVIESLRMVDEVVGFDDDDLGSCINALNEIKSKYPSDELIFCNGGDRKKENCPEMRVKDVQFVFGIGGENKKNSSSWILKDWQYQKEKKIWGEFYELFNDKNTKVKELIIMPKKGLSFQRHFKRNEIWFISKGKCIVNYSKEDPKDVHEIQLGVEETFHIDREAWHQIINPYNDPCHIIEIQYGERTEESDIERLHYYQQS